jgi:hypothetical protein
MRIGDSKIVTIRARAFGGRLETLRAFADADGGVWVFDSVAGHYTSCHGLGASAVRRVRLLAQ